jgi:GTP pyrophosphokinase
MLEKNDLIEKVRAYDAKADVDAIARAYEFCKKSHSEQTRASGEPYYTHPVEVAEILTSFKLDTASIITGLLHDTVEDTEADSAEIEKQFGSEIARLVEGVTKLNQLEVKSEGVKQAENFRKLVVAMSEDIRVLMVKLADRLHNMRTLHHIIKPDKRSRIARETLDIYAPLAERIGMHQVKEELQDLAFQHLHPDIRDSIINRLNFLRKEGKDLIDRVISDIKTTIGESGIVGQVSGREKKPYSIWIKMQNKDVGFEQLSDIMAFRIIVGTIEDCYRSLGAIHSRYHMIPERFKDYISTPKPNDYSSIHTTVLGPANQRIEVQIRTYEMHEFAEYGVAAHWLYKQKGRDIDTDGRQFRWIRELLEVLEGSTDPEEVLENTKLELYHDQVFCFTPKGDLLSLPKGSTPVDFAYTIHSDVGNTCVGSKVNGRIVPLKTVLNNGDQVDIIRSKTATPSPTWERFVATTKAKAEIRKFVRVKQRAEYINLGRAILEKTFFERGHEFKDKLLEPLAKASGRKSVEDILAEVGEGLLNRNSVIDQLFPPNPADKLKNALSIGRLRKRKTSGSGAGKSSLPIKGLIPGMALHFAGCCHPLPGDRIAGIVTTGKGVTIHTQDCDVLADFKDQPERWIDVAWEEEAEETGGAFVGRVYATIFNKPGALAAITNVIARDQGNINNLKILNRSTDFFEIMLDIEVKNSRHLNNILASLRALPVIQGVDRFAG